MASKTGSVLATVLLIALSTSATLGNVGPGLGLVGASGIYDFIHDAGKFLLTIYMILGRLELTVVLALLTRALWSR